VSIRGRVAIAIDCLENTLYYFNVTEPEWQVIVGKFWKFTSVDYLDVWFSEINECDPYNVLERVDYDDKGIKYLTKEGYKRVELL